MTQKQNTTQNIIAPNNDLEILKKNFPNCFDKNGDFDFEKFQKELEKSEVNFSKESYGMDWLGKSYARLLATDPAKTLIKEDKDWNNKEENKNSENLLIKGDNLEVLKHLSNAYHEKVKMIYIDPPYNTGSDGFVYEDDRKFTVEEFSKLAGVDEEQAKKILSFIDSKSNSHSAWLTFMYPRLYIAKQLLKEDGVIFVSIDDNEVAQLRILMDEIFGEENFVSEIIWNSKYTTSNDAQFVSNQHEPILFYAKNKKNFNIGLLPRTEKQDKDYKNKDNDPKGPWKATPLHAKSGTENNIYTITFSNGKTWTPPNGRYPRYSKEKLQELYNSGELYFNSNGGIDKKTYLSEVKDGLTVGSLWKYDEVGHTHANNEELANLVGKGMFDNPKGSKLIKRILTVANANHNSIILDFFAGSGTTGDAVMQLNAEDKANGKEVNRKYILVQLPELIDAQKNKTAYNFVKNELGITQPTIFEITKERLIRAGKKIGDTSGFKIFETQSIWEDYEFEAKEFDAQTKLFDESKLSSDDLETLLTTWKTYDNISLTESLESVDLDGYIGQYSNGRLYLMSKGFETKHLKAFLNKIDEDTTFNPVTIIVFGYHFESKVLREIAENVSSYANKKKLDIDFITRY
jgi:adenine-specific DNA-methyltransferase